MKVEGSAHEGSEVPDKSFEEEDEDSVDSEDSSEESTSEEDDSDEDNSVMNEMEVDYSSFPSYSTSQELATSLQKDYICQMCGCQAMGHIAVTSSDFTVSVYDCNQFRKISTFSGHSNTVSDIRYSSNEPHQFYTSSTDGTIRLWDTRKPENCVVILKDDLAESGRLKPFLSCDISKSGNCLCAGTELFEGDAYLDFWDVRNSKLCGAYWESHSDDITQVRFHPSLDDTVASASTDGLINVYDLSKDSEEDALLSSLNTESSIDKLSWHSIGGTVKGLTCVTDTMDIQTWDRDGTSPIASFSRLDISKMIKTNLPDTYLANIHCTSKEEILLLVGATKKSGDELLSLLEVCNEKLHPNAFLKGNKQRARCSWLNEELNYLVVGGEGGILSMWQLKTESSSELLTAAQLKVKPKLAQSRIKPY